MKKMISMVLVLAMVLSLCPWTQSMAEGKEPQPNAQPITQVKDNSPQTLDNQGEPIKSFEQEGETKGYPALYGFEENFYSNYQYSWVYFYPNNTYDVTQISEVDTAEVYAAEYYNGMLYAVKSISGNYYFGTIDPLTYSWTQIASCGLVTEMSYDYSTNTMYAIVFQGNGQNSMLATVDLATGSFSYVGEIEMSGLHVGDQVGDEGTPMAFAISTAGILYAVEIYSGKFYSINKTTAEAMYIGETGQEPDFLQSMTFDHETQTLYWACYNGFTGELLAIDTHTGRARLVGRIDSYMGAEITGLHTRPETATLTIPEINPVSHIEMNATVNTITVGDTMDIDTAVYPLDAYVDRNIYYFSSNPAVADVDKSGLVTAYAVGETTITVLNEDGSCQDTCEVTVINEEDTYLHLDEALNAPGSELHFVDESVEYPWKLTNEDGRLCLTNTNTFVCGERSYFYTEFTAGANSTVEFDWKTDLSFVYEYDKLSVSLIRAEDFVEGSTEFMIEGWNFLGSHQWTHFDGLNIETMGNYVLVWEYTNWTSAVDPLGAFGKTCQVWVDNIRVNQTDAPIESFEIIPEHQYLYPQDTFPMSVKITPDNAGYHRITWTTNNPSVVTADENGILTAHALGQATITATIDGTNFSDTALIDVVEMPGRVSYSELEYTTLTPSTQSISLGKGVSTPIFLPFSWANGFGIGFKIELAPMEGFNLETLPTSERQDFMLHIFKDDIWGDPIMEPLYAGDPYSYLADDYCTMYLLFSVAQLDDGTDVIRTFDMTVSDYEIVYVEGISFDVDRLGVSLGIPVAPPIYTITPQNVDIDDVEFSSSDATILEVDPVSGTLMGVALGMAQLTVTTLDGGFSDTISVTVTEAPPLPEYDGKLYGGLGLDFTFTEFRTGFADINKDNPSEYTFVCEIGSVFNGTYANGRIYAYTELVDSITWERTLYFMTINPITWEVGSIAPTDEYTFAGSDLAYDYSTGNMYGIYFNDGQPTLTRVNMLNGRTEEFIAPFVDEQGDFIDIMTLTTGPDGTLYGVDTGFRFNAETLLFDNYGSSLFTIDKATGVCTEVAHYDYETMRLRNATNSSMTYDYVENKIYLATTDNDFASMLFELDPVTGEILSSAPMGTGAHPCTCLYTLSIPQGVVEYELGDANMDGSVNTGDVAAILRHMVGLSVLDEQHLSYCDVNDDGDVNTGDAAMLLELILE